MTHRLLVAALLGAVLLLWRPAHAQGSGQGQAFMTEHVDPVRARDAVERLGLPRADLWRVEALGSRLRLLSLVDDRSLDACGGQVDILRWRDGIRGARRAMLRLDFAGALADFAALELDEPCLDAVPDQEDLFELHLTAAEAHLLAAQDGVGTAQAAFHGDEARHALSRAAVFGTGRPLPADASPEVRALMDAVQRELARLPRGRVRMAGNALDVRWDGRFASREGFEALPGAHLVQVLDGNDVVAARTVHVAEGQAVVLWVGLGQVPPTYDDLLDALDALAETGRPAAVLGPALDALSFRGPAMFITQDPPGADADRLRVWGQEGGKLRVRLSDPPEGAVGELDGGGADVRDFAVGIGLDSGLVPFESGLWLGLQLQGRVALVPWLVFSAALGPTGAGWPGQSGWGEHGFVYARAGLRLRHPSRWADIGVEGGGGLPVGFDPAEVPFAVPMVVGVASIGLPPRSLVGVRLGLHGGPLLGDGKGWLVGGGLSVELR